MSSVIRIGNYRLGKTLGKGSFGKVKLAEHELTGHKVAVKILNRQKIKNSQMDRKIRREIKILKLFRHPHIIRLYEVIETPTDIFMVMEYVSGGELFDYIVSHGRLSEDEARSFFQQIISGVEYCHKFMVVHRDLKPENLLLDSELNVKIADFGLSNIMEDGDFLKTSCGSPNYAAPEVISGKLYAGPEVDVWSCGVILYALLCGRLPFDEESIPSLFRKIKEGIYSIPNHLSEGSRDLIQRILVVDPLKRASIAEIRAHPWFQKNLPPYLALHPIHIEKENTTIDDECLRQALRKVDGFDYDQAVEAIHKRVMNEITVAYFLILDHKKRKTLAAMRDKDARKWSEMAKSPPDQITLEMVMNSKKDRDDNGDYSPHGSPSHSSSYNSNMNNQYALESTVDTSGTIELEGRWWNLGIETYQSASDVITEVYRVLKEMHMVWKVLGPFYIKCKYAQNDDHDYDYDEPFVDGTADGSANNNSNSAYTNGGHSSSYNNGFAMTNGIPINNNNFSHNNEHRNSYQDFQIQQQHHPILLHQMSFNPHLAQQQQQQRQQQAERRLQQRQQAPNIQVGLRVYKCQEGGYLLDVRKLAGDTFPFMDFCARLYSKIRL